VNFLYFLFVALYNEINSASFLSIVAVALYGCVFNPFS